MKTDASRKIIFTGLLIVFLSSIFGLVGNLLTGDDKFGQWLKDNHIETRELVIGVIVSIITLLIFTYLQFRYAKQAEQTSEKDDLAENIESDVKRFYDSLKERYRKRYQSKLDGRFEITLEVSENWDGENTEKFKGEYEGRGQISEAFEYISSAFEKQGRLLIVGNPGVGKTVLLLKLALESLEKADIEKKEAFPIIFNLASWSNEYKNFDDWLVSVLNSGEGLSKDFAGKLLQEERIIFLLDGLDELARDDDKEKAAEIRAECLQSLNEYLDRGKKAIICCRGIEFELMQMLTGKDAPVSAKVEIQNLTPAEILNALIKAQTHENDRVAAGNLLTILEKDENKELLEVLSTPFYFTTALEVFDKQILDEKDFPSPSIDLKIYLRKKFIEKKLKITPNPQKFSEEKTKKWLTFLAELLNRGKIVNFELSSIQPFHLKTEWGFNFLLAVTSYAVVFTVDFISTISRHGIILVDKQFFKLVVSHESANSISGLFLSLYYYILLFFLYGILFFPLALIFAFRTKKILTEDINRCSLSPLKKLKTWKKIIYPSLLYSLMTTIILILYLIAPTNRTYELGGLFLYIALIIFSIIFIEKIISQCRVVSKYNHLKKAYQRLLSGTVFNLVRWGFPLLLVSFLLTFFSRGSFWDQAIFLFPIIIGLFLINSVIFNHFILRFCLVFTKKIPVRYATFLDYAAEARILEKDGGHWRFRHQNLQDYFANLDEQAENPVSS